MNIDRTGQGQISLKWKLFFVLSLVLVLINGSFAYLVYHKTAQQFEADQADRRVAQIRDLDVVLSSGFESLSTFASFIPQLSVSASGEEIESEGDRIASILSAHGLMLDFAWGIEGVHYFAADDLARPVMSWPERNAAPKIADLMAVALRDDDPQGVISCGLRCFQVVVLPLLEQGRTAGFLVVERALGDLLREFHEVSGADIVFLKPAGESVAQGVPALPSWSRRAVAMSNAEALQPTLLALQSEREFARFADAPQRIRHANEWYEVFSAPLKNGRSDLAVLMINRVTGQVQAIREATTESIFLGLSGLLLSELILLGLMSGPMRRIEEVVELLPALADKTYPRLHEALAPVSSNKLFCDEIDLMVDAIAEVSRQIDGLERARSAAERGLRASEQSLQLAHSMAMVASCVGEPAAGVFRVTQGAARIHEALAGVTTWAEFLRLIHIDDRSRVQSAWRESSPARALDIAFRLVIGERTLDLHAKVQFTELASGSGLHAAGMLQDVTDLRAAERMVKTHRDRLEAEVAERTSQLDAARREAERLAQARSDFLASMSHEIRTPLNAVLGLSQIGMQQSHNRKIADTFEQILDSGGHLLRVVNEILDLSKLEAGKFDLDAQPFELQKAVSQCVDMLQQRIEAKGLGLQVRIADDVPAWLTGDVFRLQQILINLLSNAVKFTERGGVELRVFAESEMVCFEVVDSGLGMTPDHMDRLFTPFHQAAPQLGEPPREGTGLGLSISNKLAALMHGEIRVSSELGVGSRFVLRLPLVRSAAPAQGRLEAQGPVAVGALQQLAGIRALVVDDAAINRTILKSLLEAQGAVVTTASAGADALGALIGVGVEAFDIVLMDVEMPGLNGREAASEIRRHGLRLPIIGVTAHASAQEREASLAAGMDDQLVKPVMHEVLVDTVLRYVDPAAPPAPDQAILH